jgi:HEAT repeat protein
MLRNLVIASVVCAFATPALAGRGASPKLIQSAIASGSADAIKAELERAETLPCAGCIDLVTPLVDHQDPSVRQVAAWFLVRRGISAQIRQQMYARLVDVDSIKARNAADVLGEMQHPDAIPQLQAALVNNTLSAEARAHVAAALGTIGELRAQNALQGALSASEPEVRAQALQALRALRGFSNAALAVPLLADPNEAVRIQAIYTLGMLRSNASIDGLVSLLQSDSSVSVRKKAAWALGEIGAAAHSAAPALLAASQTDASPLVRSLAAAALGKLNR